MSTLTQFGGGNAIGSIVPGLYPGDSRYLTCDGVSTTPVTSANSSLAKVYPSITSISNQTPSGNFYVFHAYNIAYGALLWIVVGAGSSSVTETDTGYCLTSPDLITWTPRPMPHNCVWRSITWTGSRFIAVGADAAATTGYGAWSVDGVNWNTGSLPSATTIYRWVVSVGGRAFALSGSNGTSYYSDDGGGWSSAGT